MPRLPIRALVVDDEHTSRLILTTILEKNGVEANSASSKSELETRMRDEQYDLVFLDYLLGRDNGIDILEGLIKEFNMIKVVMITAHGSIALALESLHKGAAGFVTKPFDADTIERELDRILGDRAICPEGLLRSSNGIGGIIGKSSTIQRLHTQIERMKDVSTTVLITGESGTGKELIARALHDLSKRSSEKFEAVNCAAIPEALLEAELFGYKKGAFTDAKQDRQGLFEVCSRGTLFLDEIGELPLSLQGKLLRVLQEKVVMPLGSSKSMKVETRVVAATNRRLLSMANEGLFRKDLFYRLSILQIESPRLRDRLEDLPELTRHFVEMVEKKLEVKVQAPTDELMSRLTAYDWPGNIRELQNSLERAIVLSVDGKLSIEDIFLEQDPGEVMSGGSYSFLPLAEAKDRFEKDYLLKILKASHGNVSQASRLAGWIRTDMYRLFAKHNIDPSDSKHS